MAAFGLPVTPATVVLVMAAQGGGRIIPLAPASAGLRLAMLSYGFVEVTGQSGRHRRDHRLHVRRRRRLACRGLASPR